MAQIIPVPSESIWVLYINPITGLPEVTPVGEDIPITLRLLIFSEHHEWSSPLCHPGDTLKTRHPFGRQRPMRQAETPWGALYVYDNRYVDHRQRLISICRFLRQHPGFRELTRSLENQDDNAVATGTA